MIFLGKYKKKGSAEIFFFFLSLLLQLAKEKQKKRLDIFFFMITILPSKVKLLHFPRSHLAHVTHAIVKACFFQDTNE
jgi:hypothetical protein